MATRMLVDATHLEETRVVVVNKNNRLDEFDFETSTKKTLKGNIYLAKVTRVEPSLQAAFVEYGGNRHGFLAFGEIHPDYYQIPVADRQRLLRHQAEEEARAAAEEEARANRDADRAEASGEAAAEDDDDHHHVIEEVGGAAPAELGPADDSPPSDSAGQHHSMAADAGLDNPSLPAPDAKPADAPAAASADSPLETLTDYAETAQPDILAEAPIDVPALPDKPAGVTSLGGDAIDEVRRARRFVSQRHYKIQEVIKRRQIMLVQVVKEERGNKGAALTTYLSLAGRYCVLMPNTARGGGISRKIVSATDRKRLKSIAGELEVPDGMGVIVRTAGMERSKAEIKRDFEFLLRTWDSIRELTLKSTAPCLVYEEANLIKRAIRDLYSKDIDEVLVEGDDGYRAAKDFMKMLMPSHAKRVQPYRDPVPLFHRFQVETQLDAMYSPVVQLRSGGYIVINPTEALVAIDVNSGRATREHNIEETAHKTNLEAAEEVARQLRLRDLAGLIVIDFIDMEDHRNARNVERRLKDCLKADRARIQVGRISPFGLLEMSRQRLRPSLIEASTETCPTCGGVGHVRSTESTALHVLRAIEDEGIKGRAAEISVSVNDKVAIYLLNHKRDDIARIEQLYDMRVLITADNTLIPPNNRIERLKSRAPEDARPRPALEPYRPIVPETAMEEEEETEIEDETVDDDSDSEAESERRDETQSNDRGDDNRRRRRRRRRGRDRDRGDRDQDRSDQERRPDHRQDNRVAAPVPAAEAGDDDEGDEDGDADQVNDRDDTQSAAGGDDNDRKRRRRGRRGGRRRRRERDGQPAEGADGEQPYLDPAAERELIGVANDLDIPPFPSLPRTPEPSPASAEAMAPTPVLAASAAPELPFTIAPVAVVPPAPVVEPRPAPEPIAIAEPAPEKPMVAKAPEATPEITVVTVRQTPPPAPTPMPVVATTVTTPAEPVVLPSTPVESPEIVVTSSDEAQPARRGWWSRKG